MAAELSPILFANMTALEVLLSAGTATRGLRLARLPPLPERRPGITLQKPSRQYETALLSVYRRLMEHDPALAHEQLSDGMLSMHSAAAANASFLLSPEFIGDYLDILAAYGASPTAKSAQGFTALHCNTIKGASSVVRWLCEKLGPEEVAKETSEDGTLAAAGVHLNELLRQKASPNVINRHKQAIRILLAHGASIASLPTGTPKAHHVRRLLQDIQEEMQPPASDAAQQQYQGGRDAVTTIRKTYPQPAQMEEKISSSLENCIIVHQGRNSPTLPTILVTRELAIKITNRSLTSADDVARLVGGGADVTAGVSLRVDSESSYGPVSLLTAAVKNTYTSVDVWRDASGEMIEEVVKDLKLPAWESRETQRAVVEALIAAGADIDGGSFEHSGPIHDACRYANVMVVDALLTAGAATVGMRLASLPASNEGIPSQPSREYEDALLDVYRRVLNCNPSLASEQDENGVTPMHSAALERVSLSLSCDFMRLYLDLLAAHGAPLTTRNARGESPLDIAVAEGTPDVVEWLCGKLGPEEINRKDPTGAKWPMYTAIGSLYMGLRDKAPLEEIDRAKQVIRTLLEHGASVDTFPTKTALQRRVRSYVLEIQQDICKGSHTQQQEIEAVTAAKIAEELIAEEAKEKAKKAKKGGGKGSKTGSGTQPASARRVPVCEGVGQDKELSVPSVSSDSKSAGILTNDGLTNDGETDEWPLPTSSADPQSVCTGVPSSSCSVASAVPAPATPMAEASDGEFIPVVCRKKNKKKDNKQQRQPLVATCQEPYNQRQILKTDGVATSSSGGTGLDTPTPAQSRRHRGPPPLVPTYVRPSVSPSALPPRPQHAPPPAPARPLGPSALARQMQCPPPAAPVSPLDSSLRHNADQAPTPTTHKNSGSSSHVPVSPPAFSALASSVACQPFPSATTGLPRCGTERDTIAAPAVAGSASDSERLVDQLCRQLEKTQLAARQREEKAKEEKDALIRQLQETQWKLAQAKTQQQMEQHSSPSSGSGAPLASAADDGEHLKCDVCMDKDKNTLLIPCRHLCLCGDCAGRLMSGPLAKRLCPRCRQPITDTQEVFV